MRLRVTLALALASLALSGCVQEIKESRVRSALIDGGLPEDLAGCMAHRMAGQLKIAQLRKLQALSGPKRSIIDYIEAVRRVHDTEALRVTLSSAALCRAGIIQ